MNVTMMIAQPQLPTQRFDVRKKPEQRPRQRAENVAVIDGELEACRPSP